MDPGKRKLITFGLVAVLVVAAAAVVLMNTNKNVPTLATVVDASGTSVTLNKTPERIVSCSPAITEMVCAMGMGDKLVAVTDYDDYPEQAKALKDAGKTVGGFSKPSSEMILNYTPDLILLESGAPGHDQLATELRDMGYPVVVMFAQDTLADVYKCIGLLGNVTGKQTSANTVITSMKDQISLVESKIANATSSPNVMFIIYLKSGFKSVYVAGANTAINEIITLGGGTNAFSNVDGFKVPSDEVLKDKASSVDAIFLTIMYSDWYPVDIYGWLKSDPLWSASPAVQNNSVYFLEGQAESIYNRQSVRMADAVQLMAEILHPDSFTTKVPHNATGVNIIGDEYIDYIDQGTAVSASTTMMASVSRD